MRGRWMVLGVLLATGTAMTTAGCKQKALVAPPACEAACYRPLSSPGAVLRNLELSYAERGPGAARQYAALLDAAVFTFVYYDPQSSTPGTPKSWGFAQDTTCTSGLLTDPAVSRIDLTFPLADTSALINSPVTSDPAGTKKITIQGIVLQVQKGDILYQASGAGDFYIAPIAGQWKLIRWEDRTSPPVAAPVLSAAVGPATWGTIKSLYGCKPGQPCDGVVRTYLPATSYVAPLYNLVVAYSEKGEDAVNHYKEIIDQGLFQFRYYDPQSSTPTIPKFWGYSEDVNTTSGLLTDPDVSKIDLTFPLADTSGMVPSSVVGDPAGTMKITINGILLYVQKGDVLYQTTGSGDFYVAPISGIYKLIRWEDNTAPPAAAPRGALAKGGAGSGRLAISRAVTPAFAAPGSALLEAARRADALTRG